MVRTDLRKLFKGKVVIVGIGNPLRGDDGLGPALVQQLQGQVGAICLDAGTSPETYAGKIVKERPDTVVLVDAVHLGLPPGEYAILGRDDILKVGFTTHDISPELLMQYLEAQIKADIFLLGVQPHTVDFGVGISDSVQRAVRHMATLIKEALNA